MKSIIKSGACATMLCLLLALCGTNGCSKKANVDTVKLEYVQASDTNTQKNITDALDSISSHDYSAALAKLKQAASDPKLTADQKSAVDGVIAQLEKQ